ncbi:MAG: L-aspartate oxidase [Dehalococcoidales bacterium]|jgi:L-aspartate oxidase
MKKHYDFVIVGSGIAGLYTALLARALGSVLIITKGRIDDCNTRHAQGGIAAAVSQQDSPELHYHDTIMAGNDLCNEEAVHILVSQASDRISELVNFGVPFDTVDGKIALTTEAAHSLPRILHAGGDATGEHIEVTLSRKVRQANITVLENCLATNIRLEQGRVAAVNTLNCENHTREEFGCRYLILATGGAGQLYKFTTNSEIATGDGVALAFEAGAEITDAEFFQFHPTALMLPGVPPFLISEAVRGEGGILRNTLGEHFMPEYASEADLAPRDVVTRSIVCEMNKTGSDRVFIDARHLSAKVITTRFPQIYRFSLEHGLDITRDLIPVAPAAHYFMGGIKINTWGETNIEGLFAAGETACTGVHGANRLASNSLIEVLVFGKRIFERIARGVTPITSSVPDNRLVCHINNRRELPQVPPASLEMLQELLWEKIGIIRDLDGLYQAAGTLAAWQQELGQADDRASLELKNLVLCGRLVAEAALAREESRGAHFRADYPLRSSAWQRHIVLSRD